MPHYPRRDYAIETTLQLDGFNACPFEGCNSIELHRPTSTLKVDSGGNPFYLAGDFGEEGNFPTYDSWRCLTCNRSFRTPSFMPDQSKYPGFHGQQKGTSQAEF